MGDNKISNTLKCLIVERKGALGAGEEYNFCNQPTQDKDIDK